MSDNLAQTIKLVFGSEGSYVNHPKDPGGPTKYGITAATLGAWRRLGRRATAEEVMALRLTEATEILDKQYAQPLRYAELPPGLDYALFDFAVNSFTVQPVKELQRVLGVEADGIMGVKTLAAIRTRDVSALINGLCDRRMGFLRGIKGWPTFGKGWTARVAHVRQTALRMAGGVSAAAPAPETGRETANPADTKISATTEGKGTIAATIGAAGAAIGQAKDAVEPLTGNSWLVDNLFTILTVGGVTLTIAGIAIVAYQQLKHREAAA